MKYKLYFNAVLCDRLMSDFMRGACNLNHVGIGTTICITTTSEPTAEYIEKMTKHIESTKDEKTLKQYYTCVEHIKTEVI